MELLIILLFYFVHILNSYVALALWTRSHTSTFQYPCVVPERGLFPWNSTGIFVQHCTKCMSLISIIRFLLCYLISL